MEELINLILKEFEKRQMSIDTAKIVLSEVSAQLNSNSVICIKKDK